MCDAAPGDGREMEEAMTGRLLPGEGVVDYPALFATLAQIGADPFIATEIFNGALLAKLGQQGFANASITSASSMAKLARRDLQRSTGDQSLDLVVGHAQQIAAHLRGCVRPPRGRR